MRLDIPQITHDFKVHLEHFVNKGFLCNAQCVGKVMRVEIQHHAALIIIGHPDIEENEQKAALKFAVSMYTVREHGEEMFKSYVGQYVHFSFVERYNAVLFHTFSPTKEQVLKPGSLDTYLFSVDEDNITEYILVEVPYKPIIQFDGVRNLFFQLWNLILLKRKKRHPEDSVGDQAGVTLPHIKTGHFS